MDKNQVPGRAGARLARIGAFLPRRPAAARLVVTFGLLLVGWIALSSLLDAGGIWVSVAFGVSVYLGFVLSLMLPTMHEATHGAIARSRFTNRLVGWIAGALLLIDFETYRSTHLRHHCVAGHPGDPEEPVVLRNTQDYFLHITPWYFLLPFWCLSWAWLYERPIKKPKFDRLALIFFLAAITVSTATWPVFLAFGYWLPLLMSAAFLFFTTAHEHVLLEGDSAPLTRTVKTFPTLEFLLWNSNYHVAHHKNPSAPFEHLPQFEPHAHTGQTRCIKGFVQFQLNLLRDARQRKKDARKSPECSF